jgi:hypothetical protein
MTNVKAQSLDFEMEGKAQVEVEMGKPNSRP